MFADREIIKESDKMIKQGKRWIYRSLNINICSKHHAAERWDLELMFAVNTTTRAASRPTTYSICALYQQFIGGFW